MAEIDEGLLLTRDEWVLKVRDELGKRDDFFKERDWLSTNEALILNVTGEIVAKAQLAKVTPIIEKPLCKKIDKLQAKLITTNVYYLKEIQEAKKRTISKVVNMAYARVDINRKPEVGRFYDGYEACRCDVLEALKENDEQAE